MPKGLGSALKEALGQEDLLAKIQPRKGGASFLMNKSRRGIFQYILEHPCTTTRRVSRDTGIPHQTARWHVLRLLEAGYISARRIAGSDVLFPPGWIEVEDVGAIALLANDVRMSIVVALRDKDGMSQSEIARTLGTYSSKIQQHLHKLEKAGILSSVQAGRRKRYSLTNLLTSIQEKYLGRRKETSKWFIELLEKDGLNPLVEKRSSKYISLKVSGGKEVSRMKLYYNPITFLER